MTGSSTVGGGTVGGGAAGIAGSFPLDEPANLFMDASTTVIYNNGTTIDLVEGQDSKRSPRSRVLGGPTMTVNAVYKDLDDAKYGYLLQLCETYKGQPVSLNVRGKYYTGRIIGDYTASLHDLVYDLAFVFRVKL